MGKNKNWCTVCLLKHYTLTGKKSQNKKLSESEQSDVLNSDVNSSSDDQVIKKLSKNKSKSSKGAVKHTRSAATSKKDLSVKKASASGQLDHSGSGEDMDRLDQVEERVMASMEHQLTGKDKHKLSTSVRTAKQHKTFGKNKVISESSESSEDDMQLPSV